MKLLEAVDDLYEALVLERNCLTSRVTDNAQARLLVVNESIVKISRIRKDIEDIYVSLQEAR